jgi:hypothetical protein
MTLKFLADELALSITDVESLLLDVILDGRVQIRGLYNVEVFHQILFSYQQS